MDTYVESICQNTSEYSEEFKKKKNYVQTWLFFNCFFRN